MAFDSKGKGRKGKGRSKGRKGLPLDSLSVGAELSGRVASIAAFGAFVDVGFEKQGLLPWARCSKKQEELEVGQVLPLRVANVDLERQRFALEGPFEELSWSAWKPQGREEVIEAIFELLDVDQVGI